MRPSQGVNRSTAVGSAAAHDHDTRYCDSMPDPDVDGLASAAACSAELKSTYGVMPPLNA